MSRLPPPLSTEVIQVRRLAGSHTEHRPQRVSSRLEVSVGGLGVPRWRPTHTVAGEGPMARHCLTTLERIVVCL